MLTSTRVVKPNVSFISVGNTEVLITSPLVIPANTLSVGDTINIKLYGTLDVKSQYQFNIRSGANGNIGDPSIFNSNNVVTKSNLLKDLNDWANSTSGFAWNEYLFPANTALLPPISTPDKITGSLLLIVTGVGANGNVAVIAPNSTTDKNNLLMALGKGTLFVANGFNTTVNNNVTISMAMMGSGFYTFKPGFGTEGPSFAWMYTQNSNTNSSSILFSSLELDANTGQGGTIQVPSSRSLTIADDGLTLECTAAGITLTVPVGLGTNFGCAVIPSGTTSIASTGVPLLNGTNATLTRADTVNTLFAIVARSSANDSYVVTGS